MHRTYPLKHHINKGKQVQILAVLKEYRYLAKQIANKQWYLFNTKGKFNRNYISKFYKSNLSIPYRQNCQYQVVGTLNSFLSNLQNEFKDKISNSTLDEKTKIKLYKINKSKSWYKHDLAKQIWRHTLKRHNKPTFNNYNLALNQNVAKVKVNKNSSFDYWVRLSTLNKHNTIDLPLQSNEYFEEKGTRANFCQINEYESKLTVCLIKDNPKQEYESLIPKIGLDLGLKNPITSNNGDLFGHKFYKKLQTLDTKIQTLISNRQKQGLKIRCKRYDKLVNILRSYLKNELNRIINSVVELYSPQEVVVEKLNFTSSNVSRRMNRLISNFGKRITSEKLTNLKQELGIKITYINPAYTSQTCSSCGYVDTNNRNSEKFKCKCCGKKIHADVNGAKCILTRSSNEEISIYTSKKEVLNVITRNFIEQKGRYDSLPKCLKFLIDSNSYYKSTA